ncbi:MAG TPA: hypothetical protein VHW74_08440 [Mycobacteriales bacterium]|jgi:hypothetical protein|nr:hypothetical protein [Mycobacteriales bacterium]
MRARLVAVLALAPLVLAGGVASANPVASSVRHLPGTNCTAFPVDNVWHASVASLPVDKRSAQWVRHIGSGDLHPDFGPAFGAQPVPYGIPITYVSGSHPKVRPRFQYADESDRVGYPLGSDTKIEGGNQASNDGDRHAVIVDKSTCRLYETWHTRLTPSGWTAGSGATWSLDSNKLRPGGWTSADAAGLPILPGLLRLDEIESGFVDHAIRFTAEDTSKHSIWPARHEAGSYSSLDYPPMGARFRLKASFPISTYSNDTRVILRAMKTYGMILADNGSNWYFQGEASNAWPAKLLDELKSIPGTAFEAVDESSLEASPNSARAR